MNFAMFAQGIVLGFSIAAPVGPIGVLCIRRSMDQGLRVGLATGLGAATADAVYGTIAALGLTTLSHWMVAEKRLLAALGGCYLIYLGIRSLASAPRQDDGKSASVRTVMSAYVSTFVLTLTNPMTILSFIALFAGLGLAGRTNYDTALVFVTGVFLGSALWWLILSGSVATLRGHLPQSFSRVVNATAGVTIVAFGGYALWTAVRP